MKNILIAQQAFTNFLKVSQIRKLQILATENLQRVDSHYLQQNPKRKSTSHQVGFNTVQIGGQHKELGVDYEVFSRQEYFNKEKEEFPVFFATTPEIGSQTARWVRDIQEIDIYQALEMQEQFVSFELQQNAQNLERLLDIKGIRGANLEEKLSIVLNLDEQKFTKIFMK